jgi:hypothetical protein
MIWYYFVLKIKDKIKLIVIFNHFVQKKFWIRILIPYLSLLNPGRNLDKYNTFILIFYLLNAATCTYVLKIKNQHQTFRR